MAPPVSRLVMRCVNDKITWPSVEPPCPGTHFALAKNFGRCKSISRVHSALSSSRRDECCKRATKPFLKAYCAREKKFHDESMRAIITFSCVTSASAATNA